MAPLPGPDVHLRRGTPPKPLSEAQIQRLCGRPKVQGDLVRGYLGGMGQPRTLADALAALKEWRGRQPACHTPTFRALQVGLALMFNASAVEFAHLYAAAVRSPAPLESRQEPYVTASLFGDEV